MRLFRIFRSRRELRALQQVQLVSFYRMILFFFSMGRCHFSRHVCFFQFFRATNVIYWCLFWSVGGAFPAAFGNTRSELEKL